MPDQLALGVSGRQVCPRCGKEPVGPWWEVRDVIMTNPSAPEDPYGERDVIKTRVTEEIRIVCALCARDYPNGRRRQCPA